ncbi:Ectonucleoside triphosphate diphosphohydrolase 8, partial [Tinamus guttatus]
QYGLVFDAGSTHTSLYIYQWPAEKENGTGIVSQVEACAVSGPGISSYADSPALAGASLKPCLDKAMTIVPAKLQKETPTYLGATAGMRLLREQNSTKAEQVFAEVAKAIRQYPVDFRGAQILTGDEEGTFGWITVNYLLETLVKGAAGEKGRTLLLWAGSSHAKDVSHYAQVLLGSRSCFLGGLSMGWAVEEGSGCHPQPSATNSSCPLQGSSSPQQVSHPCYPKGYQENVTAAALYDSPCVPTPSTASPAQVFTVTGTGDPAACKTAIEKLFNFSCGAHRTCGFNGIYQPPVQGQFFAFSGFYYTFDFLNLTDQQSLGHVNSTIWAFCNNTWKELVEDFPQETERLHMYCSIAVYILTLLLDGYKFDEHTWSGIHFSKKAANTDIGWTLGFMLNLTNMIPTEALVHVKGQKPGLWASAIFFIAL